MRHGSCGDRASLLKCTQINYVYSEKNPNFIVLHSSSGVNNSMIISLQRYFCNFRGLGCTYHAQAPPLSHQEVDTLPQLRVRL